MPGSRVIVDDITNAVEEWKPPWDLVLELSREPLEKEEICQLKNVCLVESNNLLIECFTEGYLDLGL